MGKEGEAERKKFQKRELQDAEHGGLIKRSARGGGKRIFAKS